MSVMMLSDDHLRVLALAAHPSTNGGTVADADSRVKSMLATLTHANHAAYLERYGAARAGACIVPTISDADARRLAPTACNPLHVLKLVTCYVYQCDDGAAWESSLAQSLCELITISARRTLPGYEDAPWTI